jgi:predicted deacylase
MPRILRVGNVVAKRGESKKGYIKGIELNNVSMDVPVLVVNGVEDGTTLLLTSTEHGIEIQGSWVILQVMNKLNPKKLRGAVIGIPVANPTAFFAARYRS